MGERAATLASRLERANEEVIAAVGDLSDEQWSVLVSGEEWSVGVIVHHIAASHDLLAGWVGALTAGEALRLTHEQIDDLNAEQARTSAACTKAETLALVRRT